MSVLPSPALGSRIPADAPHSIIFSLPNWDDNVALGKGSKIVHDQLETTYPRFGIHMFVKQVGYTLYPIGSFFLHVILAGQHNTLGIPM